MNKYQRAVARVARDRERKRQKMMRLYGDTDNFDKVVTMQHYVEALKKCRKGVCWKGSVQDYSNHAIEEIREALDSLERFELPELTNRKPINISERGKVRHIFPITIKDRMTQRVLCDHSLVQRLEPALIYDNGASMKGKGVEFTRGRIEKHIRKAIRKYGTDFYALTFDFKSFFDSIPHESCLQVLRKYFTDTRIIGLTMAIIRSYQQVAIKEIKDQRKRSALLAELKANKSKGICLGSQVSQIMALIVPNMLDHYIKDKCGVKFYVRYMDDGVILAKDKETLWELFDEMVKICDNIGLKFNTKKTKVVKISKGFTFLKVKYRVTETGKVVKTLTRPGITRMRRKLRKFRPKVDDGTITLDDVYNSVQSWHAHAMVASSYHTRKNMLKLYNELFDGYRMTKKYEYIKGGKNGELLQVDKWQHLRWSCYGA